MGHCAGNRRGRLRDDRPGLCRRDGAADLDGRTAGGRVVRGLIGRAAARDGSGCACSFPSGRGRQARDWFPVDRRARRRDGSVAPGVAREAVVAVRHAVAVLAAAVSATVRVANILGFKSCPLLSIGCAGSPAPAHSRKAKSRGRPPGSIAAVKPHKAGARSLAARPNRWIFRIARSVQRANPPLVSPGSVPRQAPGGFGAEDPPQVNGGHGRAPATTVSHSRRHPHAT